MRNTPRQQNWIRSMRLAGASVVLASATLLASAVITTVSAQAQTFITLHSFDGTDGSFPLAGLIQATDGNLYGTTSFGGANGVYGTVFKITPNGKLTTLYNFCSKSGCTDGDSPSAGVIQATNGVLYGITNLGGAFGDGTVFKITPSGKLTTLYSFCSQSGCTDGSKPWAGLVQATNGDLYGTTTLGGAQGDGTVFKITPSGKLTTLYSFCSQSECTDGKSPQGKLIEATDGNLYGSTFNDGANGFGGTVFKITLSGDLTTIYSYCAQSGCQDGCYAQDGLVQAANGDFYGTTLECSDNGFYSGNIFSITPSGALTVLYNFCSQSGCTDGQYPNAMLIQAGSNGYFYGTASQGGTDGEGTFFEMTPSGTVTTLHNFCAAGCTTGGYYPTAPPIQATNGTFYGTTYEGGANGAGTVYSLSLGLGPFVETLPTSGKVGLTVKILGTNLKGATSVTFNGTAAIFKVVSGSEIAAKVPAGATTGPVQVITSGGTLVSNTNFLVAP